MPSKWYACDYISSACLHLLVELSCIPRAVGISSLEGRVAKSTNMVLGGDNSLEGWRELDEKVTLASFMRHACDMHSGRPFKGLLKFRPRESCAPLPNHVTATALLSISRCS